MKSLCSRNLSSTDENWLKVNLRGLNFAEDTHKIILPDSHRVNKYLGRARETRFHFEILISASHRLNYILYDSLSSPPSAPPSAFAASYLFLFSLFVRSFFLRLPVSDRSLRLFCGRSLDT